MDRRKRAGQVYKIFRRSGGRLKMAVAKEIKETIAVTIDEVFKK